MINCFTIFNIDSFLKNETDNNNMKCNYHEIIYGGNSISVPAKFSDKSEFNSIKIYDSNINPDVIVIYDREHIYKCWKWLKKNNYLDRTILYLDESGVVDWKCSAKFIKNFSDVFSALLTYRDDLINGKNIQKTVPAIGRNTDIEYSNIEFNDRILLSMVCANKKFHGKHELYSERLRIIKYFEKKKSNQFKLYGVGWPSKYRCYNGIIRNKSEAYHKSKFAFCLENSCENGYITEKIFDCFRCGIVPIYAGPPNIDKYVPKNCYIDYYQFSNQDDMVRYLERITEEEYKQYLNNIEIYMKSDMIKQFWQGDKYKKNALDYINTNDVKLSSWKIYIVQGVELFIKMGRTVATWLLKVIKR